MIAAVAAEEARKSKLGASFAEDLEQEVWLALCEPRTLARLGEIDPESVEAYVRKVAQNTIGRVVGAEIEAFRRPDMEPLGLLDVEVIRHLLSYLFEMRRTGRPPVHPNVAEPRTERLAGMLAEVGAALDQLDEDDQELLAQVHSQPNVEPEHNESDRTNTWPDWQVLASGLDIGEDAVRKRYSRATLHVERLINRQRRSDQSAWDALGGPWAHALRGVRGDDE